MDGLGRIVRDTFITAVGAAVVAGCSFLDYKDDYEAHLDKDSTLDKVTIYKQDGAPSKALVKFSEGGVSYIRSIPTPPEGYKFREALITDANEDGLKDIVLVSQEKGFGVTHWLKKSWNRIETRQVLVSYNNGSGEFSDFEYCNPSDIASLD